jgi:DNA polymerase delta subunit 1
MQIDINAEYKNCRLLPDRVDVPPLIIESWDCETARGALDRQFPQSKVPGDELFQIGTTIWRYGDDKPLYSCVHCVRPTANLAPDKMHINEFATESAMLAAYLEFTRDKVDADIRLGFNTYGFDNKYLEDRLLLKCSHLYPLNPSQYDRGKFEFGRTRGILSGCKDESNRGGSRAHAARKKFTLDADGRVQLDLYKWSSEEWQFPYGLDRVAKRVLGEQASKADLKFWEVHEKYQQDAQGRGEIADYCRIDTELPLRIINKKQVVLEAIIISRLTCLVIDDVINMRQMVRTFSKLSKAAHDNNYMFPDQPARFVVDPTLRSMMFGTGSYEGAKVFEPKRGFYNMPIATLDFAGLYPSIMRGFRLCYTTLILDPKFLNDPEVEYRTLTIPNANKNLPPFVMHWCTNSQPLVYGILTEINDKRNWAKGEMKKQQKESFLEALYNCWQNNLKLIANSFYGYTGTDAEMNPYTNKAIAASVTAYGREMIVKTKNYVETEQPGSQVIYGGKKTTCCFYFY